MPTQSNKGNKNQKTPGGKKKTVVGAAREKARQAGEKSRTEQRKTLHDEDVSRVCDSDLSAENAKRIERQDFIFDLLIAGATRRQIVKHFTDKGEKMSLGTVQNDIAEAITRRQQANDFKADQWVTMELAAIQKMWFVVYSMVMNHQQKALDAYAVVALVGCVLQLMNQRDRYLGISKAQKSEMSAAEALAKLTGIDPSRLPPPVNAKK